MYTGQSGSVLYGNKSPFLIYAIRLVAMSFSVVLGTNFVSFQPRLLFDAHSTGT